MRNSLTVLTLLFAVTHAPISCTPDYDDCCTHDARHEIIDSMSVSTGMIDKIARRAGEFVDVDFEKRSLQNTVNSEEFAILFQVERRAYVKSTSNPFISTSVAEGIMSLGTESISLISIYSSDTVFANDTAYLPGKNLTSLFAIRTFGDKYEVPIFQYLKKHQTINPSVGYLRFSKELDRPLDQVFYLKFYTTQNHAFELNTDPVLVNIL